MQNKLGGGTTISKIVGTTATIKRCLSSAMTSQQADYLSSQKVLGQDLKLRFAPGLFTGDGEKTEILFDAVILSCASSNLHPRRKQRIFGPRRPPDEFPCSA